MVKKIEELITKGLTIAIVKKNILDILLKTFENEKMMVNEKLLIELINEIDFETFEDLENYKADQFSYSRKIEQIVKRILRRYFNSI